MILRQVRMRARRIQKTFHLTDWTIHVRWLNEDDVEEFEQKKIDKVYKNHTGPLAGTASVCTHCKIATICVKRGMSDVEVRDTLIHEMLHVHFGYLHLSRKREEEMVYLLEDIIGGCADSIEVLMEYYKKHKGCKKSRKDYERVIQEISNG